MITNLGKNTIINFFSGQVGQIGDTLAFGTGTTAAGLADTALGTEVFRTGITSINADTANKRIIFKATIPAGRVETFSEIGLFANGQIGGGDLVARVVLTSAQTVDPALPTEIEYTMEIEV